MRRSKGHETRARDVWAELLKAISYLIVLASIARLFAERAALLLQNQ